MSLAGDGPIMKNSSILYNDMSINEKVLPGILLNFIVFIVSVISWLPWQHFAYGLPFVIILVWLPFMLLTIGFTKVRYVIWLPIVLSLLFIYGVWGYVNGASLWSPVFWLLTHSSLLLIPVILSFPKWQIMPALILTAKINVLLGGAEAMVGIWQFFQGPSFYDSSAAGDYVFGTLGNNSHLYAMKMLTLVVISFSLWWRERQIKYAIVTVLLLQAWLLGSAMHTVLIFLCTVATYIFLGVSWERKPGKKMAIVVSGVFVVFGSLYFVQPRNVDYLTYKLSLVNGANPHGEMFGKIEYAKRTVMLPISEGVMPALFGVGPGAWSSRASWLLSGEYLKNQSLVPVSPSRDWDYYLKELWNKDLLLSARWAHGVANQPFSTWFTVLAEFGYLGIILALLFVVRLIKCLKYRINDPYTSWFKGSSVFLVLLLSYALLFDNWIEYPRLMMPVILFLAMAWMISKETKINVRQAVTQGELDA